MNREAFRRDNHYVSLAYLKRWTSTESRVWAYRVLVSHSNVPLWKQASVRGLAYHAHLYTRVVATGHTDEVERWLDSDFESPAEDAIQKAVADARLTTQDWSRLIRFLAAQDLRTPARLMEMLQRWHRTLPKIVKDTLEKSVQGFKTAKREGRPIGRHSHVDSNNFPGRVTAETVPGEEGGTLRFETVAGRSLWLFSLKHLLTATVNSLLVHKWTILHSPEGIAWVTSDDPVVRLNYHDPNRYDFGGGWGSPGTEIFLPLSPRHLLYTKIGTRPPRRGEVVSAELAGWFQRFVIEHAHRFVFATSPDASVSRLRPRTVDAEAFADEVEQWRRWHEEQSAAEQDLNQ